VKQRQFIIVAGTLVAIASLIALAYLARVVYEQNRPWGRVTPAKVERELQKHVPIGSTRAEVAAYLDAKGIAHSAALGNREQAIMRDTALGSPVRTDIEMSFSFDERQKLTSYAVREIYTGP
jgi:hypothetical protein